MFVPIIEAGLSKHKIAKIMAQEYIGPLIKMDIEGVECAVVNQMFEEKIFPTFLCIEFDIARNTKIDGIQIANKCLKRIMSSGYQLI